MFFIIISHAPLRCIVKSWQTALFAEELRLSVAVLFAKGLRLSVADDL